MPVYRVNGKAYYPLQTSRNFEEVGIASWYGTMFHEQRTSSGERYNMLAMTAAHRTLPLPTYVQVTNLKNQRTVIVKVNDRGPFASNRIIDLSYVAAKKLGMLGHGTAMVRIRAIDPYAWRKQAGSIVANCYKSSKPVSKPIWQATNNDSKAVYFQVGAFKDPKHAKRLQQRLIGLLSAPVQIKSGSLYRVQVGPIRNVAKANSIGNRLRQLGIKSNRTSI